jgi:hypothetical protein
MGKRMEFEKGLSKLNFFKMYLKTLGYIQQLNILMP